MNTFANSLHNRTLTENGSPTLKSSLDKNVDLFFTIGALRGQKDRLIQKFEASFSQNPEIATRIALWARDVREGAGERQTFRDILLFIEEKNPEFLGRILPKVSELGRWDDLLVLKTKEAREIAFGLVRDALQAGNGLCAKWMPRKGKDALELREFLGFTPKRYRKTLVSLTEVVEQKMCAKDWTDINYQHVPSIASSRYQKAFRRNDGERYNEFLTKVEKGEAKINASAIFPYDVLKYYNVGDDRTIQVQWDALPNFVNTDKAILPMIDVSGSMMTAAGSSGSTTCMDVSISLGLYLSEKNEGPFKNIALTFAERPELLSFEGIDRIVQKKDHLLRHGVGYSTNLDAAFKRVLDFALVNKVPADDMPKYILVLSDMEFNGGYGYGNKTTSQRVLDAYAKAGYEAPNIIWWNIQSRGDNVPVKFNEEKMALVSGFSPSIVKSVLAAERVDPVSIMMATIENDRYNF
jgi:hypothetical protein